MLKHSGIKRVYEPIIQMEKWRHNSAICPHFWSKGAPKSKSGPGHCLISQTELSPGQPAGRLEVGAEWSRVGAGS